MENASGLAVHSWCGAAHLLIAFSSRPTGYLILAYYFTARLCCFKSNVEWLQKGLICSMARWI